MTQVLLVGREVALLEGLAQSDEGRKLLEKFTNKPADAG